MDDRRVIQEIPVDRIDWPENERSTIDEGKLADITASVEVHGVIQPITVVPGDRGRFIGMSGATRLAAARAAGLLTIPAIVREPPSSPANATAIRLCENLARNDLPPMDISIGLQKLIAAGVTATEAGKQVGLCGPEVSKYLALARLLKAIQDEIRGGRVSASAGYTLSQIEDPAEQAALAARVAAGELTRDQVAGAVRRAKRGTTVKSVAAASCRVTAPLGDGRTIVLSGPGCDTLDGVIRYLEDLLVRARKARPQGLEVRTFCRLLADQAKQTNAAR